MFRTGRRLCAAALTFFASPKKVSKERRPRSSAGCARALVVDSRGGGCATWPAAFEQCSPKPRPACSSLGAAEGESTPNFTSAINTGGSIALRALLVFGLLNIPLHSSAFREALGKLFSHNLLWSKEILAEAARHWHAAPLLAPSEYTPIRGAGRSA